MPTFPYAQPLGALNEIITKLRDTFPEKVDATILKKLNLAPNNESYIINTLRFLGVIDKEGSRSEAAHSIFVLDNDEFQDKFTDLVKASYISLFDLHGDSSWTLDKSRLISFMRTTDKSSSIVGARQADTFIRLAELSNKRESATAATSGGSPKPKKKSIAKKPVPIAKAAKDDSHDSHPKSPDKNSDVSLAVRIEVNLPATSDQKVYDAIFQSIRANLIDRD